MISELDVTAFKKRTAVGADDLARLVCEHPLKRFVVPRARIKDADTGRRLQLRDRPADVGPQALSVGVAELDRFERGNGADGVAWHGRAPAPGGRDCAGVALALRGRTARANSNRLARDLDGEGIGALVVVSGWSGGARSGP